MNNHLPVRDRAGCGRAAAPLHCARLTCRAAIVAATGIGVMPVGRALVVMLCLVAWLATGGLASPVPRSAEVPIRPFEPVDWSEGFGPSPRGSRAGAAGEPDDAFLHWQWGMRNVGQPDAKGVVGIAGCDARLLAAWPHWQPQGECVLAIVDSGLDLQHEDIDPSCLWVNPGESGTDAAGRDRASNGIDDDGNGYVDDVHGWNFVNHTNRVQDDQYHGTHVGALVCARANNGIGIAGAFPGVKIMLVKVFGLGQTLSSDQFATAIRYAVDNGARVLSNSYGTPSYTSAMHNAVKYTHEKGALFVCASGNSRKNMDDEEERDYPSCYGVPNQLVVGATDNRDRSTFCNFGSMVELAAPGENIFSLLPKNGYRAFSGTSQACPVVAGAAAWLWAMHPDWSALQVKAELVRTADQVRGLGRYIVGGRRLNVANALRGLPGAALPAEDFSRWTVEPRVVESSHPYYNQATATFDLVATGAVKLQLHFRRIDVDHFGDWLTVLAGDGTLIELINGHHRAGWSEVIPGDRVRLVLTSGDYVNDWGFAIDQIRWLPADRAAPATEVAAPR